MIKIDYTMKTKGFFLMLLTGIICCIGDAMACDMSVNEIKEHTSGAGVFTVTINNYGNCEASASVCVELVNPPSGYERSVFFSERVLIEKNSSVSVLLQKPLIGELDSYEGAGPILPKNSSIRVIFQPWKSEFSCQPKYFTDDAIYVPKTKFIMVPNLTFSLGKNNGNNQKTNAGNKLEDYPF